MRREAAVKKGFKHDAIGIVESFIFPKEKGGEELSGESNHI